MGPRYPDPTYYFRDIGIADADTIQPLWKALATTRFGQPIALVFRINAGRAKEPLGLVVDYGQPQVDLIRTSSPVYWLPALTEMSGAEAVDLILAERFQIATEQRAPEWLGEFSLPREDEVADEIVELEAEQEALMANIAKAHLRAKVAAVPSVLLYGKGKELEPVVRDALRDLGAEVQEPERKGIEDGLLFRAGLAAVIEIKGRRDQIRQSDVRQAVQWASDAKLRDGRKYKPIIVGNPNFEARPQERNEPLAPNGLEYARNGDVALLTTIQIYEALRQHQLGEFEVGKFWDAVFAAKGVVEVP